MSMHLQRQIDRLKKMILSVGALVEEAVEGATRAIETRDLSLAKQIIENDQRIDAIEIDVEEECLHTLALHQPVAFDLRYVVAVLKINNDLERIGDLAVNIAEQAIFLAELPPMDANNAIPFDLPQMWSRVRTMLKKSLDALVRIDMELARSVVLSDDEVDEIHRHVYEEIDNAAANTPHRLPHCVHLLSVSRNLERIADHTVNIAEDVMYMAKGDIQRHNRKQV